MFFKCFIFIFLLQFIPCLQNEGDHSNEMVQDLIYKLRENWDTPINYLEKRGYLREVAPNSTSDGGTQNQLNSTTFEDFQGGDNADIDEENRAEEDGNIDSPNKSNNNTSTNTTTSSTPIASKIKSIWNKIIHPNSYDNVNYSDSISELHDELRNYIEEENDERLIRGSNEKQTKNTSDIDTMCYEMLKNISVDLMHMKKFLKCLQDKDDYNVTILLKSSTAPPTPLTSSKSTSIITSSTAFPTAKDLNKNVNKTISTGSNKTISAGSKNKTCDNIVLNSNKQNGTGTQHKLNISMVENELEKDLRSNVETSKLLLNKIKLKFLADIHHPVYEIGKKPYHRLDLKVIQNLIDEARNNIDILNTTLSKCKYKKSVYQNNFNYPFKRQMKRDVISTGGNREKKNSNDGIILFDGNDYGQLVDLFVNKMNPVGRIEDENDGDPSTDEIIEGETDQLDIRSRKRNGQHKHRQHSINCGSEDSDAIDDDVDSDTKNNLIEDDELHKNGGSSSNSVRLCNIAGVCNSFTNVHTDGDGLDNNYGKKLFDTNRKIVNSILKDVAQNSNNKEEKMSSDANKSLINLRSDAAATNNPYDKLHGRSGHKRKMKNRNKKENSVDQFSNLLLDQDKYAPKAFRYKTSGLKDHLSLHSDNDSLEKRARRRNRKRKMKHKQQRFRRDYNTNESPNDAYKNFNSPKTNLYNNFKKLVKRDTAYVERSNNNIKDVVSNIESKLSRFQKHSDSTSKDSSHKSKKEENDTEELTRKHQQRNMKLKVPQQTDTQENVQNNDDNSEGNNFLDDYNSIKLQVNQEQEADIERFLNNLNEPPQFFRFDVDKYLKPISKLHEREIDHIAKSKPYFEFKNPNEDKFGNKLNKKPGEIYIFENNDNSKYQKRDLLTQRIKTIANKIKMNSFLDFPDENMAIEANSRNSDIENDKVNDITKPTDADFVDKFYLLNDGNINLDTEKHDIEKIDPLAINIDLDLDKKFRELKLETDKKFYDDVAPQTNDFKDKDEEKNNINKIY